MKIDELIPQQRIILNEYLSKRRESYFRHLKENEGRIVNCLFALNSGGLIGAVTYLAAKPITPGLLTALVSVTLGLLFIVAHATFAYYRCERNYRQQISDEREWYNGKLEWSVFEDRDDTRCRGDTIFQLFGWLSGACFLIALIAFCSQFFRVAD